MDGGGLPEGKGRAHGDERVDLCEAVEIAHQQTQWLDCKALLPARMRSSSNCPASKKVIDPDRYRGPLASLATHNFTFVLRFSLKNARRKGGRKR